MAVFGDGIDKTYKAGEDLDTSTAQFSVVYLNSQSSVSLCDSIGSKCIGILQNRPKAGTGAACNVRLLGVSKGRLNDSCTVNDLLSPGANGGLLKATGITLTGTTNSAATINIIGRAVETRTGGSGEVTNTLIEIIVNPYTISQAGLTTTGSADVALVVV